MRFYFSQVLRHKKTNAIMRCLSWSDSVLKTLVIYYVLKIKVVHFALSKTKMKVNTRHLSFVAVYTKSGIEQTGLGSAGREREVS